MLKGYYNFKDLFEYQRIQALAWFDGVWPITAYTELNYSCGTLDNLSPGPVMGAVRATNLSGYTQRICSSSQGPA